MNVDVISDNFLMLWFQKDSLDRVGFRIYGGGSRILNQKVTFEVLNVPKNPNVFGGFSKGSQQEPSAAKVSREGVNNSKVRSQMR